MVERYSAGGFEWASFAMGFAGALLLVLFLNWRRGRRRSRNDLSVPPQFPKPVSDIPPDLRAKILQLKAQGQKIEAIKLARERTGIGLAEAKDLVERIR